MPRRRAARRMTVGFVQVASAMDRHWIVSTQELDFDAAMELARHPPILGEPENPAAAHRAHWWCAADAPVQSQGTEFQLRRVYRTSKVPEHARCEVCGIHLTELQKSMTEMVERIYHGNPAP